MKCEFCGNPVSEEMHRLYRKHCSWTCLSRHRKEQEKERERKREEKMRIAQEKLEEKKKKRAEQATKEPFSNQKKAVLQYSED